MRLKVKIKAGVVLEITSSMVCLVAINSALRIVWSPGIGHLILV